MKALFIDVARHDVYEIRLPDDETKLFEAIQTCIGCRTLSLGAVFPNSDVLYVNNLGVFETEFYFKHLLVSMPLPDNAVIVGSGPETGDPCSVRSQLDATRASIHFMDKWDTIEWALSQQQQRAPEVAA